MVTKLEVATTPSTEITIKLKVMVMDSKVVTMLLWETKMVFLVIKIKFRVMLMFFKVIGTPFGVIPMEFKAVIVLLKEIQIELKVIPIKFMAMVTLLLAVVILLFLLMIKMEMEMTSSPPLILTLSSQDLVEIHMDRMALKKIINQDGVELITHYYLLYFY